MITLILYYMGTKLVVGACKWKPWDYGFNLEVEKAMFEESAEMFEYYGIHGDNEWQAEQCRLLVKLIDIILDHDSALECIERVEDPTNVHDLLKAEFKLTKYVNIRNYKRFVKWEMKPEINDILKDDLRQAKAWYLYNKLRYYVMQKLWD